MRSMDMEMLTQYKKYISGERGRLALLLALLLGAMVVALLPNDVRSEFASSELRFFELSEKGLQIVPASCPSIPSNPDYPHDTCSGVELPEQPQPVVVASACYVGQPFSLTISSPNSEYADMVGLFGAFYNSTTLTTYTSSYVDTSINFPSADTPIGVNRAAGSDTFSARWEGYVLANYSETYTFYTQSNDGVRLWVNDVAIVNNWTDHGSTENSGTIALTAGEWYPITLEFYENAGTAVIQLSYSSPSVPKQIIPSTNLSYSNGPVYYDIIWDDGSTQRVPASGTSDPAQVHVVNHYYADEDEYTAEVRATAANGQRSLWERTTFTCQTPVCTPTTFCAGDNLWYRSDTCVESFVEACAYGCASNACLAAPLSIVDIQTGSALVRPGNSVTITWSAENVASCVVTEDNPSISDSWSCDGSACTWQTQTSSPISSRTVYTLTCVGIDDEVYSDTVLVDVIPIFEEI